MLNDDGQAPLTVHCPLCKRRVVWAADHPFKPFCSERCRQIDLGAWASERYQIPTDETSSED
jgi:endogenous inhibitor of DNA gyrase (YacG/DUF329 family)